MSNIRHSSDCAIHNAPAYEPGPCDCGAANEPDRHGWRRDMDKAPRDGTHVHLYGKQRPHEMLKCDEPLVFTGYWDELDEAWCSIGTTWQGPFYDCTHWQPLPPPPESS